MAEFSQQMVDAWLSIGTACNRESCMYGRARSATDCISTRYFEAGRDRIIRFAALIDE
jgi:hypothetical protein